MEQNLPHLNSLILVVLINQPRDFEIARLLGWYRIPLRSAPKVVAVDFLAFYQTAAFKDDKWLIKYVAPVLGYELTTRNELLKDEPDHPHAHQEYFKIQIGPLVELPKPITAGGWKRLTFLYTTGEYLLNARTLNDLVVQSEERQFLWRSLRERLRHEQSYKVSTSEEIDLDPEVLASLLGIQGVISNDQASPIKPDDD